MDNINTIFYFCGTKADYEAQWNDGTINPRTIVFIAGTGEIYKNGIRYGGITAGEAQSQTTTIVRENSFDPSGIEASIATLNGLINGLNGRINNIMTEKQSELTDTINGILSEYVTLKKTYSGLFNEAGFSTELRAYLSRFGYVDTDSAIWTTYDRRIDSITSRVTQVEEAQGRVSEANIRQWISDGVAGIDLSTFLTLDSLKASGVLDGLLTNFSTAFVNLKSKAEGSEAVIGAWDRQHADDTITDLFGALSIQVNNLENSVTTELSSTVNHYLEDSTLPNTINEYLRTQAGLVLEANLDRSVAALFSESEFTNAKNAAASYLNTAGFITETDADSAIASIIAMGGNGNSKIYYCSELDETATTPAFNVASGQSISIGSYYSAAELGTICNQTSANIAAATAPFIISNPADTKRYKIEKVSSIEGALGSSKLYAAIQVGVEKNQSFINMVAQKINIGNLDTSELRLNANQIVLDGTTWADELHVKELMTDSIKDSDGNSIQVNYLMDKVKESSVYYAEVLNFIPGYDVNNTYGFNYYCSTEFVISEANKPAVLIAGRPTHIVLECASMYSLCGHIKVVMNGKNITGKYTTYSYDYDSGLTVNQVKIDIPRVDGNITITVDGIEGAVLGDPLAYTKLYNTPDHDSNTGDFIGIPEIINVNGISDAMTYVGTLFSNNYETHNDTTYDIKMNNWALSSGAPSGISIANGTANSASVYDHPTLTIAASTTTGTFNIEGTTAHAGTTVSFPVTIINETGINSGPVYLDFNVRQNNITCYKLGDASDLYVVYVGLGAVANKNNGLNGSGVSVAFSIDSNYSSYASCTSEGAITPLKPGIVPVTMTATIPGITDPVTVTRWIYIKDKLFTTFNSTQNIYADIYGNSDRDSQFVTNNHEWSGNIVQTKYITYDRNTYADVYAVYLYENPESGYIPTVTFDAANSDARLSTAAIDPNKWITVLDNGGILKTDDTRTYLLFKVSDHQTALNAYYALTNAITIEDQQPARQGKIVLNSSDGSSLTIYVTQSGNLGFYNILKDGVQGCISANCITPKYHWKSLNWCAGSTTTLISTDLYPYAILTPSSKWACYATPVGQDGISNTHSYSRIGDDFVANELSIKISYNIE